MRLLFTVLVALACASGASAHVGGRHAGFQARVSTIEPLMPGLLVSVLGGHERLSVTNYTKRHVVVLDDVGEAMVRVGPGEAEAWTEPRIAPITEPPDEEGLVRNWEIFGTADGEAFVIRGFLGYRPPPRNSGLPAWAIVVVGGAGAAVLAAALALPLRRRKGES